MYSLYKTNKKIEPFIDTGAYTGYKKIPLGIKGVYVFVVSRLYPLNCPRFNFYPRCGILYHFYPYRLTSFDFKAFKGLIVLSLEVSF